jgi:hypothetical protein
MNQKIKDLEGRHIANRSMNQKIKDLEGRHIANRSMNQKIRSHKTISAIKT